MLKKVLNTIPESPLDMIGATPRNNDMGMKFNLSDMHKPSMHKVSVLTFVSVADTKLHCLVNSTTLNRYTYPDQCHRLSR